MIEYECPNCSQAMRSPIECAGRVGRCPVCGEDVPVPRQGEIVASQEDASYEPSGDSSEAWSESKVSIATVGILGTIGAIGFLAIHIWTVYLFNEHWGGFAATAAFFLPPFSEAVALYTCSGWGVWFYRIAIVAGCSCLMGVNTFVSSESRRVAKVIVPAIALVLIGTFVYFAYDYAVSPTPLTPELRERLEDDAMMASMIIFRATSGDPTDIASSAEAKSVFRERIADYDVATVAELRHIVNTVYALKWSVQKDVEQGFEEWFADRNRPFKWSERSRKLQASLPQRMRNRITLSDSPSLILGKNEVAEGNLLDRLNRLTDGERDKMLSDFAREWRLYSLVYEELFGEPMPSFASDQ